MDNVIIDNDILSSDLVLSDYQAVLLFLRSTAYGDNIDSKFICPHCNKENDFRILISKLQFKEKKNIPNNADGYLLVLPKSKMEVKIRPLTFKEEFEISKQFQNEKFTILIEGIPTEIKRESTIKLLTNIREINGTIDKEVIRKLLRKMPKMDSDYLNKFIKENESGLDNLIEMNCEYCSNTSKQLIDFGLNMLSLPETYTSSLWEELFLITYYGKGGITMAEAMNMPVVKRKWHLNRIQEEVEKKNDAERAASQKSKSTNRVGTAGKR